MANLIRIKMAEMYATDTHTSDLGFVNRWSRPIVDIRCLLTGTASLESDIAPRHYGFLSAKPKAETVHQGSFQGKHCSQRNGCRVN
jgi:hypothetical protein